MVEIKYLIRGRSQNKIFNTQGKSNSSSPLHAAEAKRQGVLATARCRGCSTETTSEREITASTRALLFHIGFATLWQPLEKVKRAMCAWTISKDSLHLAY